MYLSCVKVDFGPSPFKFYNYWLGDPELEGIVSNAVKLQLGGIKGDIRLANLLREVKKRIKLWRKRIKAADDVLVGSLSKIVEDLDKKAECSALSDIEKKIRVDTRGQLRLLEVSKAKELHQKARIRWLKYGDENTSYFHHIINLNKASNRINGLMINGLWSSDPIAIKNELFRLFKKQFSEAMRRRPSFHNYGLKQLKQEETTMLIEPFGEDEVWRAIKDCDGNKAPGPDGFSLKFFKKFWADLKPFVLSAMMEFHSSGLISEGCNPSFVALIPKKADPQGMNDYRPISLIGAFYKIVAKVLASRLKLVLDGMISQTQSAFVGGRYILDNPIILSETISWAKRTKYKLLIYKVDFEKAYDSLNWKFLFNMMGFMGFSEVWIKWIKGCLISGKGSVLVNGSPTNEFRFKRGLRQGDPLSPFLFTIATEVIDMLMRRAVDLGLFHGVKLSDTGPCISHISYADDVVFIGEWSDYNAVSLKRFLRCLSLVSGLKVNHNKCKVFGVGVDNQETIRMANFLRCDVGVFPFHYLGVPIGVNMKRSSLWQPVIEKFKSKLTSWKAKYLSFAGRATLVKAVLGSLPSYYLSLFLAPKCVIKKMEGLRRDFLWGKVGTRQKIRWVRWDRVTKPKKVGGLGIGGLEDFNIAMLSKWWWRIKENPNHLWAQVIFAIHGSKKIDNMVPVKRSITGVWKDIASMDDVLAKLGINIKDKLTVKLGNGGKVRFWTDIWAGNSALMLLYPNMYRLASNKNAWVLDNYDSGVNGITWGWDCSRPPNSAVEATEASSLWSFLQQIQVNNVADQWIWCNNEDKLFSTKELRKDIVAAALSPSDIEDEFPWSSPAPFKQKLLLWRVLMGRVASKVGLCNRGLQMSSSDCDRCNYCVEDVDHLFAGCIFARCIWWNSLVWMKIPWPQDDLSIAGFVSKIRDCPGSNKWKKLVFLVVVATVWRIWDARNKSVFDGHFVPVRVSVDLIKEDSFLWITHRNGSANITWENWKNFDVLGLL